VGSSRGNDLPGSGNAQDDDANEQADNDDVTDQDARNVTNVIYEPNVTMLGM
jgi:hypothetical protein